MNFKFTKTKSTVSLVMSALIGIYFFITGPGIILDGTTSTFQFIMNKSVFFIFWFIPSFIIVYSIWSLVENNK